MKNVNEIRYFFRKAINDAKEVIGEGAKDIGAILGKVIGLIKPGQDAAEDYKLFWPELGASTNADMDASDDYVASLFSNFKPEDARDFGKMEEGVMAGIRYAARQRQEGKKEGIAEGRAAMLAEIKAAGMDISGFA